MSNIQQLVLGNYPNDGTGDDLRTAFVKTQANVNALNTDKVEAGQNLGSGAPVFLDKNGTNLRFRTLKTGNSNLNISFDSESITLSVSNLVALQENLNLNNFDIIGEGNIEIDGDITAFSLTGDVIGNVVGNLLGNVSGQVSDITNHSLASLGNVSDTIPSTGQALVWNGIQWEPASGVTGVTRIIAGSNVSISPTNGQGEVTINSLGGGGGGGDLDFGTFTSPSGFTLDLGSF